ncbi:MAG TPA: hypothetical protein VFT26_03560, partial [Pyrinomonadaceae bacterium]|nr:hypothetical protein [Pyrinomonadaceae bacterium]
EFEECYLNAYKSIDRQASMTEGMLRPVAGMCLDENQQREKVLPPRKALAIYIAQLLKRTPAPVKNNG